MESSMSGQSMEKRLAAPSFYYVLMAGTCFRRAARTPRPQARGTLRQLGRDYLAKSARVEAASVSPSTPALAA
jgi:hypothetical protein